MTTTRPNGQVLLPVLIGQLQRLRGELAEMAFALERRGRVDAADAVNAIAARLGEIETECATDSRPEGAS